METGPAWSSPVVVDRNLVSAQNSRSTAAAAQQFLAALSVSVGRRGSVDRYPSAPTESGAPGRGAGQADAGAVFRVRATGARRARAGPGAGVGSTCVMPVVRALAQEVFSPSRPEVTMRWHNWP